LIFSGSHARAAATTAPTIRRPNDWMDDVAVHVLAVGDPAAPHLAALQQAVLVLAGSADGHGHGHRKLILLVLLIVIVVIVAVCIAYQLRSRRNRRDRDGRDGRGES